MIERLRLSGLGVIDEAVLELGPGLTVLTGETGAGKTMVLTGLGLLLGERPDAAAVRSGVERADVEGRVVVPADAMAVRSRVVEAGGTLDDDVLVVARTVAAEGRSRAFLGGRSVPASVLGEVGDDLVAVHGQSDQRRLLQPAAQRRALDLFAGASVAEPLAAYREAYDRLRVVEADLADLTATARERAREADLLRHGVGEVEAADPQPGEDDALAVEAGRLGHAESLREAAVVAHAALRADAESATDLDALTLVGQADRALDRVAEHDPALALLRSRLRDAMALLDDVAGELAGYAATVEADPARLAAAEERRAVLAALRRKYGDTIDEVLGWAAEARERLAGLEGDDGRIADLAAERVALRALLGDLAGRLSAARTDAGARLADEVTAELAHLAMPQARLHVDVRRRPDDPAGLVVPGRPDPVAFGPTGVDEVEIGLTPHAGAATRPVSRGASGGELSRVMLAIEVVLAGSDPVPTMVFDEVDAGVGGAAAVEVGRRLARLARTTQVIVVTHLPQVAAFGDRHLVVRKSADGTVTASSVTQVSGEGRLRELARMLAGQEHSGTAVAHAEELLELAGATPLPAAGPDRPAGPTRRRRP